MKICYICCGVIDASHPGTRMADGIWLHRDTAMCVRVLGRTLVKTLERILEDQEHRDHD